MTLGAVLVSGNDGWRFLAGYGVEYDVPGAMPTLAWACWDDENRSAFPASMATWKPDQDRGVPSGVPARRDGALQLDEVPSLRDLANLGGTLPTACAVGYNLPSLRDFGLALAAYKMPFYT